MTDTTLDELTRAGSLLAGEIRFNRLVHVMVDQTLDITHSDLGALYLYGPDDRARAVKLAYQRGRFAIPGELSRTSELIDFIEDCGESVVLLTRKPSPFAQLLLSPEMNSGMALPVSTPTARIGVLMVNSLSENHYNRRRLQFLDAMLRISSGALNNASLYEELQEHTRHIEELHRYQESIFSSMTNLLITTNKDGSIHYFNRSAAERLGLTEKDLSQDVNGVLGRGVTKKLMKRVASVSESGRPLLGVEGIYKTPGDRQDIDFSLNVSPLQTKRGRFDGLTLLFTDQTAERQLKEQMEVVSEERRVIKDMFARYLSNDLVQDLVDKPELVKPGGGSKLATIFFADIRGYTSFSEGRDPAYIVKILNEYFNEAVEIVIKNRGYIDKFIGDCIMAAWGVPMVNEEEDAIAAVATAVEIQELVASTNRAFFTGEASGLRIGVGMHTGPLIAGNLGSSRRMDYTVIGDTVNVAARLEGVAEADEVIITEETRARIGDHFELDKRPAVRVKGKAEPIQIYNVLRKAG